MNEKLEIFERVCKAFTGFDTRGKDFITGYMVGVLSNAKGEQSDQKEDTTTFSKKEAG